MTPTDATREATTTIDARPSASSPDPAHVPTNTVAPPPALVGNVISTLRGVGNLTATLKLQVGMCLAHSGSIRNMR